jgi:DNA helicase-2/ATP-dependent DNA helicase PcrA
MDTLSSRAKDFQAPALIREILEQTGYKEMLETEDSKEAEERTRTLDDLVHRAAEVAAQTALGALEKLQAWLDLLVLEAREEESDELAAANPLGKVTLMTVHTSKGLEFPVVFVVHMMEGLFPHDRAMEDPGGIEEERRLAYVAFTRARQRLVITRSRRKPGGQPGEVGSVVGPSRFLHGLPAAVCAGDVPKLDPAFEKDERRGVDETAARMNQFLKHRRLAPPVEPEEALRTVAVHRLEQLAPGVLVLHPTFGRGVIRSRHGGGESSRALVTFGDGRTVPVKLSPCPLQILLRPAPQPSDPG